MNDPNLMMPLKAARGKQMPPSSGMISRFGARHPGSSNPRWEIIGALALLFLVAPLKLLTQWVPGQIYLTGGYVELGLNNCGCIGAPSYVFGAVHDDLSTPGFGLTGDVPKDGWGPAGAYTYPWFCGDYTTYGTTPEQIEGWSLTMDGNHYINSNVSCIPSQIPGALSFAVFTPAEDTAEWTGRLLGMHIFHRWVVPQDDLFVLCEMTLINDTTLTRTGVFLGRNMEPDPDYSGTLTGVTTNTVLWQPVAGVSDTAIVQAKGSTFCHLYLASRDSRASCNYGGTITPTAEDLWLGTGRTTAVGLTAMTDQSVGMGWNIGTMAPGDSVTIKFAYVLDSNDLDIALLRLGPPCVALEDTVSLTACDSYTLGGNVLMASGSYVDTIPSVVSGCDSIAHLDLTILHSASSSISETACASYTYMGTTLDTSGVYAFTLTGSSGCDSTVTLSLTILEPSSDSLMVNACGAYEFNGSTLTTSGTYAATLMNAAGCDSLVTLALTVSTPPDVSVSATGPTLTAQPGYAYQWLDCDAGFAPIAGETGQSFTALVDGNYAVAVMNGSCLDTSACASVVLATRGSQEFNGVTLFPNPVQGTLTIGLDQPQRFVTLQIMDFQGHLVWEHSYADTRLITADLSALSLGVYLAKLTFGAKVFNHTFSKQ